MITSNAQLRAKALVVEDEENVSELVARMLERAGYEVRVAANGREGLREVFDWRPEVLLIDVVMPEMDGWKLLERVREVSDVPILMLTALTREQDTIRGLRGGADDYLGKPFRHGELLARVDALLRRGTGNRPTHEIYRDNELHIDFPHHRVDVRGREVDLSATEFRLLAALVQNAGAVLSPTQLLDLAWGNKDSGPENVRLFVTYLRRKIEEDADTPRLIQTVRGFGYRYQAPGLRA